jgi:hypothetical protein
VTEGREDKLKALEQQETQRRLSKEQFLKPQIHEDDVEIMSMGGTVRLRSLSHRQRQDLRNRAHFGGPEYDDDLFTVLVMVNVIVDPPLTEADVEQLREQNSVVFDEIVTQISMFNLMTASGDLKKGSSETQNSDSALD